MTKSAAAMTRSKHKERRSAAATVTAMAERTLDLTNVAKSFYQGGRTIEVLKNASLSVARGEAVALTGQSGSGKSTLLSIAGLLEEPDRGHVMLDGVDFSRARDRTRTLARAHDIGFVFQAHHLLPEFTALENVMFPLIIARTPRNVAQKAAAQVLGQVGLDARLHHYPSQLSGGEAQRVAIARALVHRPRLVLADEPTGNLDPTTAATVFGLFRDLCRGHQCGLLVVTHDAGLARKMDRIVHLKDGIITL